MARLSPLVAGQIRNRWRQLVAGGSAAFAGEVIATVGAAVLADRYVRWLPKLDPAQYGIVLAGVFVAWLGLPLSGLAGVSARLPLRQFPLSAGDLWRLRGVALLTAPVVWVLLYAMYWTARFVSVGALATGAAGLAAGLAVADLLPTAARGWAVLALPVGYAAVQWPGAGQAAALAVAAGGAVAAFRHALTAPGPLKKKGPGRWRLPLPGLLRKDLHGGFRLLDVYISLAVALSFMVYAITSPAMAREAIWAAPLLIALSAVGLPLNAFGLDSGPGFDRYRLFPMSGRKIVASKALSSAVMLGLPMVPVVLAAAAHAGWAAGLTSLAECAGLVLGITAWGSWTSVREPEAVRPYRFSNSGSILAGLVALVVAVIPAWAAFASAERPWLPAVVLGLAAAACRQSIRGAGALLERRAEQIREALG